MLEMILGGALGAGLGFAYQRVVGCRSGVCPITANPYTATLYGAVMGVLFALSQ